MALGSKGATGLGLVASIAVAFHFLPAVFARKEEEKPTKLSDLERLKKRE